MKLFLILLLLTLFSFTTTTIIQATCGDTWSGPTETSSANCGDGVNETAGTLTKTVTWAHIFWLDGYDRPNVSVSDNGQTGYPGLTGSCAKCWPRLTRPILTSPQGRLTGFKKRIQDGLFSIRILVGRSRSRAVIIVKDTRAAAVQVCLTSGRIAKKPKVAQQTRVQVSVSMDCVHKRPLFLMYLEMGSILRTCLAV